MAGMKQNIVVLSASQYDMVNRETGEIVKGTSVRYALTDTLRPYEENQLKGYKLAKTSLGFDDYDKFPEVPGIYEATLNFNIDKDGAAKIRATDLVFKSSLFSAPTDKK